jgi:FAD/FMN-containing dehydrogenase
VTSLEATLADIVGTAHVLTDPELTSGYERDWTGRFEARARAVVRPKDTAQVGAVVKACAVANAAIVPQGGNTGLVGGGVPRDHEVVLSLTRLNTIRTPDPATGQVTAGAGATLAALQSAARAAGLDAGLDFAARDTCTLGGVVACDAGGARALRYGTARARVTGLEAVLADGATITRLSGLTKDNAGYDLPALFVGSEGTLGVITAVRWRLVPWLPARTAALIPLPSVHAATELFAVLKAHAPSLESCDFFLHAGLTLVLAHQRRRSPFREEAPVYVLAECAAASDPTDELTGALIAAGIHDALIADDTAGRERLWALREGFGDAINAAGTPPHKLDVGVPLATLADFLQAVTAATRRIPGARAILFGHLGDGNVHVNLLGLDRDDAFVDEAVLELVLEAGGTISAEHGIGVAKAAWLPRARSAADLGAMRAIKQALDPDNLLNPGVVLARGVGDPAA